MDEATAIRLQAIIASSNSNSSASRITSSQSLSSSSSNGTGPHRRPNFSELENGVLIAEIDRLRDVLDGKYSKMYSKAVKQKLWQQIADRVNLVGSFSRTSDEVKVKWKNIRSATRAKLNQRRRQLQDEEDSKDSEVSAQMQVAAAAAVAAASENNCGLTAAEARVINIIESSRLAQEDASGSQGSLPPLPMELLMTASTETDLKIAGRDNPLESEEQPQVSEESCNHSCPHCCKMITKEDQMMELEKERLMLKRRRVELLERMTLVKERKLELMTRDDAALVIKSETID